MAALLVQLPMLEEVLKSGISQPPWWFWDNQDPPEAEAVMLKDWVKAEKEEFHPGTVGTGCAKALW